MSEDSFQHWPDAASITSDQVPVEGFDPANGLRQYEYEPANDPDKVSTAKASAPPPAANEKKKRDEKSLPPKPPVQYVYQMPPQTQRPMMYYLQMPYACYPQSAAMPAPAYYGFPTQTASYWCGPAMPSGYVCVEPSAVAGAQDKAKVDDKGEDDKGDKKDDKSDKKDKNDKKAKKLEATKWQGRTKAEVKDDDMIIAKKEGAYGKRKIVPVGLDPDQPVWVVMSDSRLRIR
jgi:hypothetical protein